MRAHASRQGLTLVELMVTSSIATALGGAMLVLTNAISQSYTTQLALGELSGYLDAATEQLKRDIWRATDACADPPAPRVAGTPCPNPTPGTSWLALNVPVVGGWVRYTIDNSNPNDVRLIRTELASGAQRVVVHHVLEGPNDTWADRPAAGGLVTFNINTRKTVSGRRFERGITNVSYRFQQ